MQVDGKDYLNIQPQGGHFYLMKVDTLSLIFAIINKIESKCV